jgi:hypothetical protein
MSLFQPLHPPPLVLAGRRSWRSRRSLAALERNRLETEAEIAARDPAVALELRRDALDRARWNDEHPPTWSEHRRPCFGVFSNRGLFVKGYLFVLRFFAQGRGRCLSRPRSLTRSRRS